jgi:type I restriction enzyme M protein
LTRQAPACSSSPASRTTTRTRRSTSTRRSPPPRPRPPSFYVTATERASATAAAAAKARITRLFADKVVAKYPTIFPASDAIIDLKPNVVAFVISQLQGYSLLASPVDVKGVAYEEIVGSNLRGDRGESSPPATPAAWPSPC